MPTFTNNFQVCNVSTCRSMTWGCYNPSPVTLKNYINNIPRQNSSLVTLFLWSVHELGPLALESMSFFWRWDEHELTYEIIRATSGMVNFHRWTGGFDSCYYMLTTSKYTDFSTSEALWSGPPSTYVNVVTVVKSTYEKWGSDPEMRRDRTWHLINQNGVLTTNTGAAGKIKAYIESRRTFAKPYILTSPTKKELVKGLRQIPPNKWTPPSHQGSLQRGDTPNRDMLVLNAPTMSQ